MKSKAPFEILGLDHVVLRVRDVKKMCAFYCDVLGGTLEKNDAEVGLFQVRAGAQLIDLVPVTGKIGRTGGAGPGKEGHNVDHVAIRVEPFDDEAIRAYLSSHGVQAGETHIRTGAEGDGPAMYIKDPEGNTIELKGPVNGASGARV